MGLLTGFQPAPINRADTTVMTTTPPAIIRGAETADIGIAALARTSFNLVLSPTVIKETRTMMVTAYSSTPEQTDDTPHTTASNTKVRPGIIATNDLPFGTRIQIPEMFGNEIFVVEDRMHRRKREWVDVWMSTTQEAVNLGIQKTEVVILAEGPNI